MEHFYVTTPIYYVNDKPHIGHAYTTILADVLARYHRLLGMPTHFLTGTDEHGQKVFDAAKKAGISAQEQCDRTVVRFKELWERLEITHDDFIRTTETRHKEVVQDILQELWDRGEIYRDEYEGWYAVADERFYTEKELVDGKSPEGKPVEKITETNYFFKMGQHQQWLIDHIEQNPEFIQPETRRNETLGFLRQPLGDLCISRPKTRMPWGIELPFDADYVCYVWFDALVNYISAIRYKRDDAEFTKWWPASYHLIGKDIITTHSVYWPTMLKSMGLPMPRTIFAHGWWLSGESKMSKSEGNVTDPMQMADDHGVDALRYYLMADMTLGQDATFTQDTFALRYNADLANDLGNLVSRSLKIVERNLGGAIPTPDPEQVGEAERALEEKVLDAVEAMEKHLRAMSLDRGLAQVMGAVRETNRYIADKAPWKLTKVEGAEAQLRTVLYTAAEALRIISGLLHPVMPAKMRELRAALGLPKSDLEPTLEHLRDWGRLAPGQRLGALPSLFPRIDRAKLAKKAEKQAKKTAPKKDEGLIAFDDFGKVQLVVAEVRAAERVPDAERLLKLSVFDGERERQVVAGIASHYEPERIKGRTVILVANLAPAEIRGIRSEGMLLAASKGKRLALVTLDAGVPAGSRVS